LAGVEAKNGLKEKKEGPESRGSKWRRYRTKAKKRKDKDNVGGRNFKCPPTTVEKGDYTTGNWPDWTKRSEVLRKACACRLQNYKRWKEGEGKRGVVVHPDDMTL